MLPFFGERAIVKTGVVASLTLNISAGLMDAGSLACILFMAFAASVAAASSPFLYSNSTDTAAISSWLTDFTFLTRSMVDSSFSTILVTLSSTSEADAPGHGIITVITG